MCYLCHTHMRGGAAVHGSTAQHRRATRRTVAPLRQGRPAWMTALRDYEHQYDADDPGNSPEWDAAMKGAR